MNIKDYSLGIITGLIISIVVGVNATILYSAKDIEYKDTNVEEAINDLYGIKDELEEANENLQNINSKGNATPNKILKGSNAVVQGNLVEGTYEETKVYYLGTGNTFDIKTKLPNVDYTKLTSDNFIVSLNANISVGISRSAGGWASNKQIDGLNGTVFKEEISYNSSTGILNLNTKTTYYVYSAYGALVTQGNGANCTPKVYLVVGNIE